MRQHLTHSRHNPARQRTVRAAHGQNQPNYLATLTPQHRQQVQRRADHQPPTLHPSDLNVTDACLSGDATASGAIRRPAQPPHHLYYPPHQRAGQNRRRYLATSTHHRPPTRHPLDPHAEDAYRYGAAMESGVTDNPPIHQPPQTPHPSYYHPYQWCAPPQPPFHITRNQTYPHTDTPHPPP